MSNRNRVLIGVGVLIALLALWYFLPVKEWLDAFRGWIEDLGALGVVAFVGLYVIITVVMGPAAGLTLIAGLVYGVWGFPLVVGAATLAATTAFLIGRYIAQDRVAKMGENNDKLKALNKAVSEEGWKVVGLMRLSPVFPFGLQNYLFSVTNLGLVPFVLATAIGIMPGTALYVYIGSLGQAEGGGGVLQWVLLGAGLIATFAVVWLITKKARQALEEMNLEDKD